MAVRHNVGNDSASSLHSMGLTIASTAICHNVAIMGVVLLTWHVSDTNSSVVAMHHPVAIMIVPLLLTWHVSDTNSSVVAMHHPVAIMIVPLLLTWHVSDTNSSVVAMHHPVAIMIVPLLLTWHVSDTNSSVVAMHHPVAIMIVPLLLTWRTCVWHHLSHREIRHPVDNDGVRLLTCHVSDWHVSFIVAMHQPVAIMTVTLLLTSSYPNRVRHIMGQHDVSLDSR